MIHYTIGEIHRKGLLLSKTGKPYKKKETVSMVLSRWKAKMKVESTPYGPSKLVPLSEIERINNRYVQRRHK